MVPAIGRAVAPRGLPAALLLTILLPATGLAAEEGLSAEEGVPARQSEPRGRAASASAPRPDPAGIDSCEPRPDGPERLDVAPGSTGSVASALAAARSGDTVALAPGVYRERITVRCSVTLVGPSDAALDGGNEGTVVTLLAPAITVRGITIRRSGRNVSREDSGILADGAADLVVEDVRLEDVLFGVYLKESPRSLIRKSRVEGKDLPVNVRGDAIRLWYSSKGRIEENHIRRGRDVVIWFSDSVRVVGNDIEGGRYGLHYMYSDHNVFEENRFEGNLVGAFLMYSVDLEFARNVFSRSAGASGIGLGLKDSDRIHARENDFADNDVGVFLDNSPRSLGVENTFTGNRFVGNDIGVRVLPSARSNRFAANSFVDNVREVEVPGGGRAEANTWAGNHWSRYAGFDSDDDGVGDTPFVLARLSDHLVSVHPRLALFAFSPGAEALDLLARVLPFLKPRPVVVDSAPLLEPVATGAWEGFFGRDAAEGVDWPGVVLLLALLALGGWAAARYRTFPGGAA